MRPIWENEDTYKEIYLLYLVDGLSEGLSQFKKNDNASAFVVENRVTLGMIILVCLFRILSESELIFSTVMRLHAMFAAAS